MPPIAGRSIKTPTRLSSATLIVLALTLAGAAWRIASFAFNVWPHGDVVLDAAIAESLARHGRLLVPIVDVRYYPIDRFGFGYPPDQHPPLWALFGAPLVPLVGDGYTALKLVSLVVGVALVPLAYAALRPTIGRGPALVAAALTAGSYPLVDFSGNGSLWVLLAAWYLAWLWAMGGGSGRQLPAERAAQPAAPFAETAPSSPSANPRAGRAAQPGNRDRPPAPGLSAKTRRFRCWVPIGVVMGLAYLTNYPAVTLPVALALAHLLRHRRESLRTTALVGPAVSLGVMLLTIAPWLLFNVAMFGSPVWSQPFERTLAGGSRQVEYAIVGQEVVKRNLPADPNGPARLRERALDLYGNVGFTARQLLILAPVLSGLFLAGLAVIGTDWVRGTSRPSTPSIGEENLRSAYIGRRQSRGEGRLADESPDALIGPCLSGGDVVGLRGEGPDAFLPLVALTLVHLGLILWWPTTKFRYLIPLLPLLFGIGAWFLWQLRPTSLRGPLVAVTLGLCLFTNLWTMLSIPSRTYYYDGGLVADNFGQQGETAWVQDTRRLRVAADAIVARGPGVVLGEHILTTFTGQPLVVNSTAYPPEVVAHLVRKYGIRYVVAERARQDQYAFLGPSVLWSDDRLIVLELRVD